MSDITKLVEILTTYDDTQVDPVPWVQTWDWRMFDPPKFEILPREYLSYAEGEVDRDSVVSRINCIGHLKRALECQVDIFLHVWVLQKYARKERMGLHDKLKLLTSLGVLNARSVTRLNLIRNKVEHEYVRPNIQDLDAFYDLVAALIGILEKSTVSIDEVNIFTVEGAVIVKYSDTEPCITIESSEEILKASLHDDKELFVQCFHILSCLGDYTVRLIELDTLTSKLALIAKISGVSK